jgi:hypothetical protein
MYGGTGLRVSNVVFVHGSFDPWHALGITQVTPCRDVETRDAVTSQNMTP